MNKLDIIRAYDNELDSLPYIKNLKINWEEVKKNIKYGSYQIIFEAHRQHKNEVLRRLEIRHDNNALDYIDNPDFRVRPALYNPTNRHEIDNPISLESALFITPILERCMLIDKPKKGQFRGINGGFLDKGLIKLAIRIRKIIIAPGIYKLEREVVPVYTTALNEIYEKLIFDFKLKNNRIPNKAELEMLKSRAISLACDLKVDGHIIKNPDTFAALNGTKKIEELQGLNVHYAENIITSTGSTLVTNWSDFVRSINNEYYINWIDEIPVNGYFVNLWTPLSYAKFDNRFKSSLEEQSKIYHK